jgi:hypothetical protein
MPMPRTSTSTPAETRITHFSVVRTYSQFKLVDEVKACILASVTSSTFTLADILLYAPKPNEIAATSAKKNKYFFMLCEYLVNAKLQKKNYNIKKIIIRECGVSADRTALLADTLGALGAGARPLTMMRIVLLAFEHGGAIRLLSEASPHSGLIIKTLQSIIDLGLMHCM